MSEIILAFVPPEPPCKTVTCYLLLHLARGEILVHGTTHAINAIVTGLTARTVFLTTAGHPDTLVFREGGRQDAFNFTVPYPAPFVPKALTLEIPERILSDGSVRLVHYSIIEDGGFADYNQGVEWCVTGLDRNWAFNPACKAARP